MSELFKMPNTDGIITGILSIIPTENFNMVHLYIDDVGWHLKVSPSDKVKSLCQWGMKVNTKKKNWKGKKGKEWKHNHPVAIIFSNL